jgi:hypothetical protein
LKRIISGNKIETPNNVAGSVDKVNDNIHTMANGESGYTQSVEQVAGL